MTSILKRLAAFFSLGQTPFSESRELDDYLSQAQSLAELENLQRQWDRHRGGSSFSVNLASAR